MPGSVGAFVDVRYWFEVMDSFVGEAVHHARLLSGGSSDFIGRPRNVRILDPSSRSIPA